MIATAIAAKRVSLGRSGARSVAPGRHLHPDERCQLEGRPFFHVSRSARCGSGNERDEDLLRSRSRSESRVSVGSNGAIRAHCASENQKKSAIFNASSLETLNHTITALGIPFM